MPCFIARFYHTPELAPLARFLFLSFLVGSTTAAPLAYYFRNLMVKERSQIQITAIIVSGIVGVTCAYRGWGSWGRADSCILGHERVAHLAALALEADILVQQESAA